MPWSLRRSVSKGPVRLNFSRRGVGVSVGVRGLRLGTGPRGTYVRGGRGGFYYQQYLRTQDPAFAPGPAAPHAPAGVPTEFVAEPNAHGDDAIAEVNRRRASFRWSVAVVVGAVICAMWLASVHAAAGWYAPLLAGLAYGAVLRSRENAHRAIAFHYDLEGDLAAEYGRLVAAFRDAARCARIWRVVSQNVHGDRKHNAGATSSVERVPTALTFGATGGLATNVDVASLDAAGTRVFFLPDRIVTAAGSRVGSIAYADLAVTDGQTRFSEDQAVPADATRVGTTWLYVNKNGSPDRRFKNNRQLPIALYSDLRLSHPALTLSIEFSRSDAAAALAGALRRFVAMLAVGIASPAPVVPPTSSATDTASSVTAVRRLVERMRATLVPLHAAHAAACAAPVSHARILSPADSLAWIGARTREISAFMPVVVGLCSTELRPALALRADGEIADSAQDAWIASCEAVCARLTAWEVTTASASLAPMFREAQSLMRGLTTEYVEAIASLPEQLAATAEGDHHAGVHTSVKMERLAPLNAELARLTAELAKGS